MQVAVIIPAAGAGRRYRRLSAAGRHKLDEDLGGRPVLQRTVELFTARDEVIAIIVAGPHDEADMADFRARHGDRLGLVGVRLVRGGPTHRWETVHAALEAVPPDATHIAVHDAARPCTPGAVIDRVWRAAESHPAVIPAIDVGDTVKRVRTGEAPPPPADPADAILSPSAAGRTPPRLVDQTLDRIGLVLVQTPQLFAADLLRRAYAQPDLSSTDDAQLVERLGEPVVVVNGDARNIKITVPDDLALARAIFGVGPPRDRPVHKRF